MEYIRPCYYEQFSCIADACEDTCCSGWQIAIDENSLKVYQQGAGGFYNRLHNCIDWNEKVFERDCDSGRCAFLNENNLCDLYEELGEEYLCKTCREFPRHIEEYEDVREESLSLACPVAAELILSQGKPVEFLVTETDEVDDDWDFDYFYYTKIMDARTMLLSKVQDENFDCKKTLAVMIEYCRQLQCLSDEDKLMEMDGITEFYKDRKEVKEVYRREHVVKYGFKLLDELEVLRPEWTTWCHSCTELLETMSEEEHQRLFDSFLFEIEKEEYGARLIQNLLVYFLFVSFGGSVYDGEIENKLALSVMSMELVMEMCFVKWYLQEKTISFHDVTTIARLYSREVEHSDVNLERMEKGAQL